MRIGDYIRIPYAATALNKAVGPKLKSVEVMNDAIKANFRDGKNLGINLAPDLSIIAIFLFDPNFSHPQFGNTIAAIVVDPRDGSAHGTEVVPDSLIVKHIQVLSQFLLSKIHDDDFVAIGRNLSAFCQKAS